MKKEMIEKIREKVILANNLECKNYDEALEKEFLQEGCIIKSKDEYIIIPENKQGKYCIYSNNYSYEEDPEELSYWIKTLGCACCSTTLYESNYWDLDNPYEIYKILGLPLTFERVLVALKIYKNIQPLISYDKNNFMSISVIKEQEISEIIKVGIISNHLFSWQPNKTLENQSDETLQAIYHILCV